MPRSAPMKRMLELSRLNSRLTRRAAPLCLLILAGSLIWGQLPSRNDQTADTIAQQTLLQRGPRIDRPGMGARQNRIADRSEYPTWDNSERFRHDVFTFARIRFDSYGGRGFGQHWNNDYPDCDWNFSYRLHQLTSMKVDPNGVVLRLTDDELFDYPFIYISNAQEINLSNEEVSALRRHLTNGGFLMADDLWAPAAWNHVREVMREVLPDREPRELNLDHEIFRCVYRFEKLPQVPSILAWRRGERFEYWHGDPEGDEDPHFYGYHDDSGRLVALICHNNDIGDGWEREGEDVEYFEEYSEKFSYPLGINIIVYAMTH